MHPSVIIYLYTLSTLTDFFVGVTYNYMVVSSLYTKPGERTSKLKTQSHADTLPYRQTDRQTERQTDRQTDRDRERD